MPTQKELTARLEYKKPINVDVLNDTVTIHRCHYSRR